MPRSAHNQTLGRVRAILADACERDGQGDLLTESSRRKAYRQAINDALAELDRVKSRPAGTTSRSRAGTPAA